MKGILAKVGPLHVLIAGAVLAAGMGVGVLFFMIKPKAREIASITKKIESERKVMERKKSAERKLAEAKKDYKRAKEELERVVKGKFIDLPKDPDKALTVYVRAVKRLRSQLVGLVRRTGNVLVSGPTGPDLDALRPPEPNEDGLITYPPAATAGGMGGPMGMGMGGPMGPGGPSPEMMGAMGMGMGMEMGGGTTGNAVGLVIEGNFASIVRFLEELKNFDYPVTVLNITLKSTGRRGRTVRAEMPLIVYLAMGKRPKKAAAPSGPGGGGMAGMPPEMMGMGGEGGGMMGPMGPPGGGGGGG